MSELIEGNVFAFGPDGILTVFEIQDIKRFFFIRDVPYGERRGGHAHKECIQYISCPIGSFKLELTLEGGKKQEYFLNNSNRIIKINPKTWVDMLDFASGTIVVVAATHHYDPDDYMYNIDSIL